MTVLISATKPKDPLSQLDIEIWSKVLSRYSLKTLKAAVGKFIDTGDNFPSAAKLKRLAKDIRANELGIPARGL